MWYDNEEENKTKSTSTTEAAQDELKVPTSPFAGGADPTKAFDDDHEEGIEDKAVSADEISSLKATIKDLDEKAKINYDRYLRALAEMDNYKKRAARERADLIRSAGEDLLVEILPVVDNLERTMAHLNDNLDADKIMEGINLIYKQFVQALDKSGITTIEQAPCAFDPTIHQALQRVEDKSVADDTVVEVLQKGYTLNGKVVRPAMVKVAKH